MHNGSQKITDYNKIYSQLWVNKRFYSLLRIGKGHTMTSGVSFYRCDTHTIMSGLVVRYRLIGDSFNGEISASREGVLIISIPHLTNVQEVLDVQRVIGRAYEQFTALYKSNPALAFFTDPPCVVELRKYQVMSQEYSVLQEREYAEWQRQSEDASPTLPEPINYVDGRIER